MEALDTPILFIVFNRPYQTKQVFETIRHARPKQLFVAADGPRIDKEAEKEKCNMVRSIATSVDWDCELKILFRNENLGCGKAVSEAITWFFENVEAGIIIEDDCFPDISFFYFCEQLLEKYKNYDSVITIGGTNLGYTFTNDYSYSFSRYMNMWGWATWRRSIKLVDYEMKSWRIKKYKEIFLLTKLFKIGSLDLKWIVYWRDYFNLTSSGQIDTWDYQWIYAQISNKKVSIFPSKNLIKNIGFSADATHTFNPAHPIAKLPLQTLQFPLKHTSLVKINDHYEEIFLKPIWFGHNKEPFMQTIKTRLLYIPIVFKINQSLKKILKTIRSKAIIYFKLIYNK